mmetsp:Transcript_30674/g.99777  ORF Transcript_30674/g.99777 Transcript_30674/m.99777 type:complete len:151 (-) Transcript_30674:100-552(-)|eukprot:CAMPEP_0170140914 /NCGR_PEP_ID=MMETSP0033_2-20121228/6672_1 /TAXON_ID=195969 /ORGANISM="Dolichomastix tenuilepis, Strain CCMP3274" /LENGTH=150 /DNA_ID=CAMNT_0010377153 /DNA_START=37 /DNA_END=489 /DNA_ORIENTATION=-
MCTGGSDGSTNPVDDVIQRLHHWVQETSLEDDLEEYIVSNCWRMLPSDESGEQPLCNTETHNDFVGLLSVKLDRFAETEGVSEDELFERCAAAQTSDPATAELLEMLLKYTDYETFYRTCVFLQGVLRERGERNPFLEAEAEAQAQPGAS